MDENAEATEPVAETADPEAPAEPRPKAPPIESRFLYVDVAAMRANYVDVTPAGPTQIANYEDMGYEKIVMDKPKK